MLIAGIAGLLAGILIARRSHRDDPVVSLPGHVLNYLASATVATVPLAVITGLILGDFREGIGIALRALAATIVLVLLFGGVESLARRNRPEEKRNAWRLAWDRWNGIARPIGDFNAWVLMGLFYFTLMLPFGLISRLFSDRLRLKKQPDVASLWVTREQAGDLTLDDARRQY